MNRTAGSRRRRRFGAGSTATRDNPEARTSSSRHCPPFTLRSSKTRRCAQLSLCDRRRVPGGAGVSGRVAETDPPRIMAMNVLGGGLFVTNHHEDALSVYEAELSMNRRLGASEANILRVQGNLAVTYASLERLTEALHTRRDVYSGQLKLNGEENSQTILAAYNYATSLANLQRFEEALSLIHI